MKQALRASIDAIIDGQLETARRYAAQEGYYPQHVIDDIRSAAVAAQNAIARAYDAENAHPQQLAAAVARERESWLGDNADEDGYGSATFHEIAASLRGLASD